VITLPELRESTCKSCLVQELAGPDGTWHYTKSSSESSAKAAGLAFGIAAAVVEVIGSDPHENVSMASLFSVFLFELGWSIELNLKKETLIPFSQFQAEYYVIGMQGVERSLRTLP
jgi:hypothetical protein